MENASKALLMAAGVLVGVAILSLAAYLFITFSNSTDQMKEQIEMNQLNQFNNQFLSYEGKQELTIYDILTVTHMAENNNSKYELKKGDANYITVQIGNEEVNSEYIKNIIDENIDDVKELKNYTCKASINNSTGRVNKVIFKENNT